MRRARTAVERILATLNRRAAVRSGQHEFLTIQSLEPDDQGLFPVKSECILRTAERNPEFFLRRGGGYILRNHRCLFNILVQAGPANRIHAVRKLFSLEAGMLGSGGGGPPVNSASTPLTGQQLYAAYGANRTQADASYTNKTIFIRDSLDFGVGVDRAGQYFSSVNSGSVVLIWSGQAQLGQLGAGETVLAKCSVQGTQPALGGGYVLYLQNCDLISVQAQTTSSPSVSVANL
jgi:hypothetical protein